MFRRPIKELFWCIDWGRAVFEVSFPTTESRIKSLAMDKDVRCPGLWPSRPSSLVICASAFKSLESRRSCSDFRSCGSPVWTRGVGTGGASDAGPASAVSVTLRWSMISGDCFSSRGLCSAGSSCVSPGSRMIRAVTWIDSGLPRDALPLSNADNRLTTDPDRSRDGLMTSSGEVSSESAGDLPRMDLVLSKTEGDRAPSLTLLFRTEMNADEGRSFPAAGGPPGLPAICSKALIRDEMPVASFPGCLGARWSCWPICWFKAALVETDRVAEGGASPAVFLCGLRTGVDTVRTTRGVGGSLG